MTLESDSTNASDDDEWPPQIDGIKQPTLEESLRLTPEERVQWLEGALDVALKAGVLQREAQRRDAELKRKWGSS